MEIKVIDYKETTENLRKTLLSYIECMQKVQLENEELKKRIKKLVSKVYELETILNIYDHRKMDEVILSRTRQEAYDQGYQDEKVDGYNLAGTQMPSAKQERKKGKWIWQGSISEGCWVCSECKSKFYQGYGNENFCPNCGTDMRGEEDE